MSTEQQQPQGEEPGTPVLGDAVAFTYGGQADEERTGYLIAISDRRHGQWAHIAVIGQSWLDSIALETVRLVKGADPVAAASRNLLVRLLDGAVNGLEAAWGIIANAGEGDWQREHADWRKAAERWRDQFIPSLSSVLAARGRAQAIDADSGGNGVPDEEPGKLAVQVDVREIPEVAEALAKLQRVTDAIRTIDKHHNLGDAIYDVRSRAVETMPDGPSNSWEHPNVTAYSAACEALRNEGVIDSARVR